MTQARRSAIIIAASLLLISATTQAQYGRYGGGYWGGYGGGQTVQGSIAQGMGIYAAGAGQYNRETAQANAINANTAMQFNQYVYQSRLESERIYHDKLVRDNNRSEKNAEAMRVRLRDNPNEVDIKRGDALNVAMDELSDPKNYARVIYLAGKMKVGGEAIRDIPFQYASAAISVSVNQLTQGGAPAVLKNSEVFAQDRTELRAIAAELRKEGDETGTHKPETIQKAKARILATKAKIEATFPRNSADRVASDKYIKALYGFVRMLETPAVDVLLAGVEKHPEVSLGDLMQFMSNFNLRFGAAQTPRQNAIYRQIYPMLVQLRSEMAPAPGSSPEARPSAVGLDAPMAAFDNLSFDQLDGKTSPPPVPQAPK